MKKTLITLTQIVCSTFDIVEINTISRKTKFIYARAIIYSLMRNHLYMTYQAIGKVFNKNHATIIHATKELPFMLKYDKELNRKYEQIVADWLGDDIKEAQTPELVRKNLEDEINLLNLELLRLKEKVQTQESIIEQFKKSKETAGKQSIRNWINL